MTTMLSPPEPVLKRGSGLAEDPEWFRHCVIYEVHVRAFADSNGDGIGDFAGLTSKLDYLAELGVTALWLLPFYPSPGRDDGYDIAEYTSVNPAYGDLASFKRFLREAHRRNIRVITELVLNHTSDQHEWFQRSRTAAPGSHWRDFYVWSDTTDRYADARIIFSDFETSNWTWDPVADAYFWHRFYSHQPDLNFDHPPVAEAMLRALDFWLDLGVDGIRLDAVPYLFEREGTNCENLPETHAFLKRLRAHVDERYSDRMLLAEANQWPEDAAAYFGDGDECHMNFDFPVMPRLFMGLQMENRTPIVDIIAQTPKPPRGCQWASFLRNHDELTLEMVTDEERDYMVRSYAADPEMRINLGIRRRLAPLMNNDRRKIELLNALLLSLPGTPVLYYGDEIGLGDNVYLGDRDGVRTPMQWNADRNAGFSSANPQRLYLPLVSDPAYHFQTLNVEAQSSNPSSLLWWMRQMISLHHRHRVLSEGSFDVLQPDNHRILAFVRRLPDQPPFLVVANLSRLAQPVELDLGEWQGSTPIEVQGATRFAEIGELPYYLTLAPYGFLWFSLEAPAESADSTGPLAIPELNRSWRDPDLFTRPTEINALSAYIRTRRWYGGRTRSIRTTTVVEAAQLGGGPRPLVRLLHVTFESTDGTSETYQLPVTLLSDPATGDSPDRTSDGTIAVLRDGVLTDAMSEPAAVLELVRACTSRPRPAQGRNRWPVHAEGSASLRAALTGSPTVRTLSVEQSNSSATVGDLAMVKLIRRIDEGTNPDLELGRHLTRDHRFPGVPEVLGALELERRPGRRDTALIVTRLVANDGDGWTWALDELGRFFDRAFTIGGRPPDDLPITRRHTALAAPPPEEVVDLLGPALDAARLVGVRTAQLHAALADDRGELRPERFTTLYQRSLYQSLRARIQDTLRHLERGVERLEPDVADRAHRLIERGDDLLQRAEAIRSGRIEADRIRIHGDLHLGQILATGRDLVFIDFEGEPMRPIGERRIKRTPMVDIAGMLRSFEYAAAVAARTQSERGRTSGPPEDVTAWADWWATWTTAAYLSGYRSVDAGRALLPDDEADCRRVLHFCLTDKALYELRYELDHRPDWVGVPIAGLVELLEESP